MILFGGTTIGSHVSTNFNGNCLFSAAVDQAVSLNDQAIMVDFLSVITLRPSIWNLDLCESLLPILGELLQSKYEM